jgi:hypothetical protein
MGDHLPNKNELAMLREASNKMKIECQRKSMQNNLNIPIGDQELSNNSNF